MPVEFFDDVQINIEVKTITDKTFTFEIMQMDTIADIKSKIQELEGIPVEKVVVDGETLKDHRTLRDYDIQNGSSIYVVRLGDSMHIKVLMRYAYQSPCITLEAMPWDTIGDIKAKLRQMSFEVSDLKIGHNLLDDHHTLSDYNIQNGSTISTHRRCRCPGQCMH